MKIECLTGEVLLEQGQGKEANTHCTNILARQQEYFGDDHLDTLETLRRLGLVYKFPGRRQDTFDRIQKRSHNLFRILGDTNSCPNHRSQFRSHRIDIASRGGRRLVHCSP